MADPYQQIPEDKRDKILQAAIREFAERGYEKASTNQITQEAQISKGLLFHYFKSKKNLYLATFDRCIDQLMNQMLPYFKDLPSDFFERLSVLGKVKIRLYVEQPLVYSFIVSAFQEMNESFPEEILERMEHMKAMSMPMVLEGIDRSKFRPDIDLDKAIRFIYMGLEALGQQMIQRALQEPDKGLSQWEEAMKEYEAMMDIFKYGVYRSERERERRNDSD